MKLRIVGSGDAFGTGGRSNTCFRLDGPGGTLLVDFGASALVAWNRLGLATTDIDAIVFSHLHGDHFGGVPFLLLESQFLSRRKRPLTLLGPVGLAARLEAVSEALFPGMWKNRWSFPLHIIESAPGETAEAAGFRIGNLAVSHPSGAVARALRIEQGGRTFAYSGDTAWVDALFSISAQADLFVIECYSGDHPVPHHIDWATLRSHLPQITAKRTMVTHMGPDALPLRAQFEANGLLVAEDGAIHDV